jgi:alkylation response protein AidB-like acyl-CoA dehydrogenase
LILRLPKNKTWLRTMVRDFGRKELEPGYKDRCKTAHIPVELIKKIADLGLMGLNIPEIYGGFPKTLSP